VTSLGPTPSQTVGPYLAIGLTWPDGELAVPAGSPSAIWLRGRLLDGEGDPVPDGMVETWQADPEGHFTHPDDPRGAVARTDGFSGFGRCATGPDGAWAICTLKPGPVPTVDGVLEAPHINVSVFARGLLDRVVTRVYFDDEAAANMADPVLMTIPSERRATIVAASSEDGYRLDIRLQGAHETAFFAL
jgi:protocatechuate 3,4-dioxygenase alpha subunit